MLHVAQRAVAVVRRSVRVGRQLLGFLGNYSLRMALHAGVFIRILGVVHVGTVAGLAGYTAGDVAIRTELFRSADRAAGDKGSQTQGNQKSL